MRELPRRDPREVQGQLLLLLKSYLLQLREVVAHALRTFAISSLCEPHTRICRFERTRITSQLRIVLKRCAMAMDMPAFEVIWSRVDWISFFEK